MGVVVSCGKEKQGHLKRGLFMYEEVYLIVAYKIEIVRKLKCDFC